MQNSSGLRKNSLGLFSLVFFVVAAASPLTGIVGSLPVAIFAGNGAGVPVVYLAAFIILALFSVGFIHMSRYVSDAGAFYTYISKGLGERWGASASFLALFSYFTCQIGVISLLGFFTQSFVSQHFELDVPWWVYSATFSLLVWFLGIRKVEVGGKLLGVLMIAEVVIALVTAVMVLLKNGATLNLHSFEPSIFMQGNIGLAFVFAISSFIGYESTAIYAEECKDPEKTVPRATMVALLVITAFFCFTSWALLQAYNVDEIVNIVKKDPGNFVFNVTKEYVGPWATDVMAVLLITSLFAASQAFHNNISRYIYSISRDGLIWKELSAVHPTNGTPHKASHLHSVLLLLLLIAVGSMNVDPMLYIFPFCSAGATLSILLLQLGVSSAVILFFRKGAAKSRSRWKSFWAPLLSMLTLIATILLVVNNLQAISGSDSPLIKFIPWLLVGCVVIGYVLSYKRATMQQSEI